jgi:hypothetical protein
MTAPNGPSGENADGKDPNGKKKYPAGTVVIWIAGAGIGLWFLISERARTFGAGHGSEARRGNAEAGPSLSLRSPRTTTGRPS